MRRTAAAVLQRQQRIQREIRSVRQRRLDGVARGAGGMRQNVDTPSAPMSSTRIVSLVQNGSP